jgi:hypothetical protein
MYEGGRKDEKKGVIELLKEILERRLIYLRVG